jgi:hypothetical protein
LALTGPATMAIRPAGGNTDLARQQRIGDELADSARWA